MRTAPGANAPGAVVCGNSKCIGVQANEGAECEMIAGERAFCGVMLI